MDAPLPNVDKTHWHVLWTLSGKTVSGKDFKAGILLDQNNRCYSASAFIKPKVVGKHLQDLLNICYDRGYKFEFVATFDPQKVNPLETSDVPA